MKRVLAWSWSGIFVMLGGCLHTSEHANTEGPTPKYQVKCSGECLELNKRAIPDQAALLGKVEEFLKERRNGSVEVLVERHAERVIEIFRQRDSKQAPAGPELRLAQGIDTLMQHPSGDGWQDRLQSRGRGGIERAEATLHTAQDFARNQQWAQAVALLEKNQAAIAPFPYHAIRTGLILGEAHRHLGQTKNAIQSWRQTAVLASRVSPRLHVPDLWEQVAGQRPVSAAWPPDLTVALMARLPTCLHDLPKSPSFAPEALVWFTIGNSRLARTDASLALTALKRADSHGALPNGTISSRSTRPRPCSP